jgi:hypothetical protein
MGWYVQTFDWYFVAPSTVETTTRYTDTIMMVNYGTYFDRNTHISKTIITNINNNEGNAGASQNTGEVRGLSSKREDCPAQ